MEGELTCGLDWPWAFLKDAVDQGVQGGNDGGQGQMGYDFPDFSALISLAYFSGASGADENKIENERDKLGSCHFGTFSVVGLKLSLS